MQTELIDKKMGFIPSTQYRQWIVYSIRIVHEYRNIQNSSRFLQIPSWEESVAFIFVRSKHSKELCASRSLRVMGLYSRISPWNSVFKNFVQSTNSGCSRLLVDYPSNVSTCGVQELQLYMHGSYTHRPHQNIDRSTCALMLYVNWFINSHTTMCSVITNK